MNKFNILALIIIAAAFLAAVFLTLQRVDVYLELKAIDDCAKISKYEVDNPDKGTRVWYPVENVYQDCLREKGY